MINRGVVVVVSRVVALRRRNVFSHVVVAFVFAFGFTFEVGVVPGAAPGAVWK